MEISKIPPVPGISVTAPNSNKKVDNSSCAIHPERNSQLHWVQYVMATIGLVSENAIVTHYLANDALGRLVPGAKPSRLDTIIHCNAIAWIIWIWLDQLPGTGEQLLAVGRQVAQL